MIKIKEKPIIQTTKIKEKTGYITAVGVQVHKELSMMYIEIDKQRIDLPKNKEITIKVKE